MNFLIAAFIMTTGLQVQAEIQRDVSKYNLQEDGVQLKGFDPVTARNNEKSTEGSDEFSLEYENVIYKFSSLDNQNTFLQSPGLFEPTYGGWCAMAMAMDSLVDIKPELFYVMGDRIHYFSSRRAMRRFVGDAENLEAQANANWETRSGEAPPAN